MKNKKKKMKTRTKFLIAAVLSIILYTITNVILLVKTGQCLPDTLTISWYSFWTVEILSVAGITKAKIKNNYISEEMPENE